MRSVLSMLGVRFGAIPTGDVWTIYMDILLPVSRKISTTSSLWRGDRDIDTALITRPANLFF